MAKSIVRDIHIRVKCETLMHFYRIYEMIRTLNYGCKVEIQELEPES